MRQESVSLYPRRPEAEAFSNAVDVVEHLHVPSPFSFFRSSKGKREKK